jgi:hypothetical protein
MSCSSESRLPGVGHKETKRVLSTRVRIRGAVAGQLLERRPDLEVALLADGSHENWTLLGCVGDLEHTQVIDFWHLIEKLSEAG